jgi:hypothetical protein
LKNLTEGSGHIIMRSLAWVVADLTATLVLIRFWPFRDGITGTEIEPRPAEMREWTDREEIIVLVPQRAFIDRGDPDSKGE